jgi:hypothetical protein
MTDRQSLEYAETRLALAAAMGDGAEVSKWREHVEYWREKAQGEA